MNTNSFRSLDPRLDHAHTSSCWWNHEHARWVCSDNPTPSAQHASTPISTTASTTQMSSTPVGLPKVDDTQVEDAQVDDVQVDVRDMLVVHTALLREFRLIPQAVAGVAEGDRNRARTVDRHLRLLTGLLHHHHRGEDELLWPVLRDRLAIEDTAMLDVVEAQHAGIERVLNRVATERGEWVEHADLQSRSALIEALRTLYRLLTEHLEAEERHLLPLAAAHLTEAEWLAVGEAGATSISKTTLPLVFGMFAYEGDPEVLAGMLKGAPLVPRLIVPRIAPRAYARRAAQIYGTQRP